MIDEIHVSNVALIRDASFSPSRGLTAITGETGAGKTALLSACKLLVGERQIKPQFVKVLTAYRSKAVSSLTALLTSPRG